MKCSRCQTENANGARFCSRCGDVLARRCPRCATLRPPSDRFCSECGHDLSVPADAVAERLGSPYSYTPQNLAEKIINGRNAIEGERKLVTVVFVDVANYTSICDRLDIEDVHRFMDECMRLIMDEIHRYEGIVTQFTGDGIMAIFGAPLAHEDHAQRACHAALSIMARVKGFGERLKKGFDIDFTIRIGINSGPVIVGSIGDDLHMDYTALGNTTNLASRMERMASPGSILASRDTYRMAKEFFDFKALGRFAVKGKEEPVEVYELCGTGPVETRLGAAMARGLTRFVGREKELGSLKNSFEEVKSGRGQVVGIVGEAGVGKSRLIYEFKNTVCTEGCTYLEGSCFHYGRSMAYLPVLDMLRSFFNVKEGLREQLIRKRIDEKVTRLDEHLRYVLPPLHELFSLPPEDETFARLEPKRKRERTFEAIRDLLVRESVDNPLVLTAEDLHWADKTTEEFFSYLIEWLVNTRIMLILAYRPEYTHPWANKSYYTRTGLGQLPSSAGSEMVQHLLEGGHVSPELEELITSKAGGNPLFLEELTYALLEEGSITRSGEAYVLGRQLGELQTPDTIQGIIAARMDRLEEDLKRILQIASVIGRNFSFPILNAITDTTETLKSDLLALQTAEFIYEKRVFPEVEYMFKHALVQEVAYTSLLQRKRRDIHEKIGLAMERLYGERIEEFYEILAYHFSMSTSLEKGYTYLKLSADKAAGNSSLWEAFRYYREALNVLRKERDSEENRRKQVEIIQLMVSPLLSLGFPEQSLQILQEGEKLARDLGDGKSLITLSSAIGLCYSIRGDLLRGLEYNEKAFKVGEEMKDIEILAPIAFDLCSNYAARGEHRKMADLAPRVLALLEAEKREGESFDRGYNLYSTFAAFYGFSMGYLGRYDEGKAFCAKAYEIALKTGNLYSLGLAKLFLGYVLCHQGEGGKAVEHFEKAIPYLEKGQIFVILGLAWSGIGWSRYFMGDLGGARDFVEKGLRIHSDAGIVYNLCVHHWFLSVIYCDLGDLTAAKAHADRAISLARKSHEVYYVGTATASLGRILGKARKPRIKPAEKNIREGIETLTDLGIETQAAIGWLYLGELHSRTGEREKATAALDRAEEVFRRTSMAYWLERAQHLRAGLDQTASTP